MQTTKEKTTTNLRLLSFLIALSMVFSVSIEGFAAGGDGSGGGGGSGTDRIIDAATATVKDTTETTAEIELYFHSEDGGMKHYNSTKISDFVDHCSVSGAGAENVLIECENTASDKYYSKEIVSISRLVQGTEYTFSYDCPTAVSNGNTYYLDSAVTCTFTTAATIPEMTLTSSIADLTPDSRTTLKVEGGQPGYQYEFWVHNNANGKDWKIQSFSTKDSCEWYAGPGAGHKILTANVKDSNNQKVDTLTLEVDVSASELKIDSITSSVQNLTKSTTTTLTAQASGGVPGYEYRFTVYNTVNEKPWTIRDFDGSNSCSWYAGPTGGTKIITVEVRDQNDTVATKTLILPVEDTSLKITSITSSVANLSASSYTTLKAQATGGQGALQYRFQVYNTVNEKWWTIQKFGSGNSCNWYAGPGAGSKFIYVDVKDAKGNVTAKVLPVSVK